MGSNTRSDDGINCSGGGVQFQRSINGGVTWQSPISIPNSPVYGTLDVDTNGNLFIGGEGPAPSSACARAMRRSRPRRRLLTEAPPSIWVASSVAGESIQQDWMDMVFLAIDRSGGATNNNIYMLASVVPTGRSTTDVMFVRSTDGGLTFSAPQKDQ